MCLETYIDEDKFMCISVSCYYQDDGFGNLLDTEYVEELFTMSVLYHFIEQCH